MRKLISIMFMTLALTACEYGGNGYITTAGDGMYSRDKYKCVNGVLVSKVTLAVVMTPSGKAVQCDSSIILTDDEVEGITDRGHVNVHSD